MRWTKTLKNLWTSSTHKHSSSSRPSAPGIPRSLRLLRRRTELYSQLSKKGWTESMSVPPPIHTRWVHHVMYRLLFSDVHKGWKIIWTFERPQASTSPLTFCVVSYIFVSEHRPLGILCQKWDYHTSREHIYCWTQWYFLAIPSQSYGHLNLTNTQVCFNYMHCNISNLHKSPKCRTSSLLHEIVMPYKYAYYEFQIKR